MRKPQIQTLLSTVIISIMLSACAGTTDDDTIVTGIPASSSSGSITPPSSVPVDADTSITPGMEWKYFKGTQNPGSNWNSVNFADSSWLNGNSGFGYGDGDDATTLSDMSGNYRTVYTRKTFFHNSATTINKLTLTVDYDDGFIAYLNGVEIARSDTMPAGAVTFDTSATNTHEAGTAVNIDIASFINILNNGDNVISVEVHNQSVGSSDLSLITSLYINEDAPAAPSGGNTGGGGGGGGSSTPDGTFGTLANYTNVSDINRLSFISDDLSGITYNPVTDTYFMIQNNGGRIWEVNKNFVLLRTIIMQNNSFDDSEDIVYLGNQEYAIVNEASRLFIVTITADTLTLDATDTDAVQTITFGSNGGNVGPEGVAFDAATQTFYIVKEETPKAIYSFVRPGPGNQTIVPNIPFDATAVLTMANDLSAITFDPRDDTLLILSHKSHLVVNVRIDGSEILGVLELADTTQHEGLTFDENFDLQITSEANIQRTYATP